MSKFPFEQFKAGSVTTRRFASNVDPEELVWHRDRADRHIRIVEARGWFLQLDDELPIELNPQDGHFIPAKVWHRVLKKSDCGDLIVEIREAAE